MHRFHHLMASLLPQSLREFQHAPHAIELFVSSQTQLFFAQGLYCLFVFFKRIDYCFTIYAGQHHRCNASTCTICLRTCTGDPVSSPRWASSLNLGCDSTANPLSQSNTNNSSPRRRRPCDEDSDNVSQSKDVDSERSGCGQMVCRMCCFEHPQRSEPIEPHRASQLIQDLFSGAVACLDCSAKQLAPQTYESNGSMQEARNSNQSLIAPS